MRTPLFEARLPRKRTPLNPLYTHVTGSPWRRRCCSCPSRCPAKRIHGRIVHRRPCDEGDPRLHWRERLARVQVFPHRRCSSPPKSLSATSASWSGSSASTSRSTRRTSDVGWQHRKAILKTAKDLDEVYDNRKIKVHVAEMITPPGRRPALPSSTDVRHLNWIL